MFIINEKAVNFTCIRTSVKYVNTEREFNYCVAWVSFDTKNLHKNEPSAPKIKYWIHVKINELINGTVVLEKNTGEFTRMFSIYSMSSMKKNFWNTANIIS
jgi:hypothetical protein